MNKVKSNRYYYNPDTDTIYAREFDSHKYYHEERHAKDLSMNWYRRLNSAMDMYLQLFCMGFTFFLGVSFVFPAMFYQFSYTFIPYALFRVQEEIRAYLYARDKVRS